MRQQNVFLITYQSNKLKIFKRVQNVLLVLYVILKILDFKNLNSFNMK